MFLALTIATERAPELVSQRKQQFSVFYAARGHVFVGGDEKHSYCY